MSQAIPESVVNRIKKLLALAGNNSNEHESTAAAEKAQSLLQEYNLELSQVGDAEPAADAGREKISDIAATADWQVTLMAAIAENNFCTHWTAQVYAKRTNGTGRMRNRRRHFLIGRRVNIVSCSQMYEYLMQSMERLCPYEDRRDRSTRSWFEGCSDRLRSRLSEQRRSSEAASRARRAEPGRGSGTDLVLSDVYSSEEELNTDFRYGYAPGTTAARRAENEARQKAWVEEYRARRAADVAAGVDVTAVSTKVETEAQRRNREDKEARANERWEQSYRRRQEKEAARVDQNAYYRGADAGRGIGLDRQVQESRVEKLG